MLLPAYEAMSVKLPLTFPSATFSGSNAFATAARLVAYFDRLLSLPSLIASAWICCSFCGESLSRFPRSALTCLENASSLSLLSLLGSTDRPKSSPIGSDVNCPSCRCRLRSAPPSPPEEGSPKLVLSLPLGTYLLAA